MYNSMKRRGNWIVSRGMRIQFERLCSACEKSKSSRGKIRAETSFTVL